MTFKDSPEGQTHFYGDGCEPPHSPPECTCASFFTVRGKHKLDCPCHPPSTAEGEKKRMKGFWITCFDPYMEMQICAHWSFEECVCECHTTQKKV